MKNIIPLLLIISFLTSCAPVLSKFTMSQGILMDSLSEVKEDPKSHIGELYILGGIIVKTTTSKEGSLLEAVFVPVNSTGYLKSYPVSSGRFLALYRNKDILDPLMYSEKREITLAGEFMGLKKGMIGEMEYSYPFFEIKEIYLWPDVKLSDRYPYYYYPPPYPPYYYRYNRYRFYDPWWYYY